MYAGNREITNKVLWIFGTIAAALIVAATSWNFSAVAKMPDKYVTKQENREDHAEIKSDIKEIKRMIIDIYKEDHREHNSIRDGE